MKQGDRVQLVEARVVIAMRHGYIVRPRPRGRTIFLLKAEVRPLVERGHLDTAQPRVSKKCPEVSPSRPKRAQAKK